MLILKLEIPEDTLTPTRQIVWYKWPPELEIMETFGPKNSFDHTSWIEKYQEKPLLRRVFDQTTWTQDEALRVLQEKIVLGANLWALIITIPLTVIFVAIPKGNFY
jgi:hypothetical protein